MRFVVEDAMSTLVVALLAVSVVESPARSLLDHDGSTIGVVDAWEAVSTGIAVLVDVREKAEIAEGMAAPALWFPASAIEMDPDRWHAFLASLRRGKTLIFYCSRGGRSLRAAADAASLGYRARSMAPFSEWVRAGLPVRLPEPRS